jgi:kynurenine formamidase
VTEPPLEGLVSSLATGAVRVVDLTSPLTERTPMIGLPPPYENAPGWSMTTLACYDERGENWYWNSFSGSEHMGTHFDAPVHWITGRDGEDVGSIPGAKLIGPAVVLDRVAEAERDPDYLVEIEDVEALGELPADGWLLLRTGWSERHTDPERFLNGSSWPGVSVECSRYLTNETPLRGYGCEQVGIDWGRAYEMDPPYPMHYYMLGAGKYGLASLADLGQLPERGAVLIVAPLRIAGGSGAPVRVYALVSD